VRELERALESRPRLVSAAEAGEQVGPRGVEVLVAVQVEPVDDGEAGFSPSTSATAIAEPVSRTSAP
jgi:hypothetical protein